MKLAFALVLIAIAVAQPTWRRVGRDSSAHRSYQPHTPEEDFAPCTQEAKVDKLVPYDPAIGSFYVVDGVQGITGQAFVRYRTLPDGRIRVCDIGVRLPAVERVTHCLPQDFVDSNRGPGQPFENYPPGPFCPPGANINIDIPYPAAPNRDHFKFISTGFGVNNQGHPNGNYEEYRHAHSPPSPQTAPTWSWNIPHVDAHFFFKPASFVDTLVGWVPGETNPPADVQAACDCEPSPMLAASVGHYSEHDCIPGMGRHWPEDKLETQQTFASQPALLFGTYACESFFWEPMVAQNVSNWVRDNAPNQRATITWPQPERYSWSGWYPTHYFVAEAAAADQIGGKRTIEIGFTRFVFRQKLFDRFVSVNQRAATLEKAGEVSTPVQHEAWFTPVIAVGSALIASILTVIIVLAIVNARKDRGQSYQRMD